MTIEVKQLHINSEVMKNGYTENNENNSSVNMEVIKEDIIEECKRLLVDMLRERQER